MLGMTRWTPFTELATVHRDLDSLFGPVFGELSRPPMSSTGPTFTPAADVRHESEKWTVSIAIAGIDPKNVEISVVGRTLRVRGERALEGYGDGVEPVLREIAYGRFEREFTLPAEVDSENVHATYRHGMLEVTLPVRESAKPHRVDIKTIEAKQLQAA